MQTYIKNCAEIKDEYFSHLLLLTSSHFHFGIKSMYNIACKQHDLALAKKKANKSPGKLRLFQGFLQLIPNWNITIIKKETTRIKQVSNCPDWIEVLLKACCKSLAILLTGVSNINNSKLLRHKFYNKIDFSDFVHKTYINCSKKFYENPALFIEDGISPLAIKKNQRDTADIIKYCIIEAVKQISNMKQITLEYIANEETNYVADVANPADNQNNNDNSNKLIKDANNRLLNRLNNDFEENNNLENNNNPENNKNKPAKKSDKMENTKNKNKPTKDEDNNDIKTNPFVKDFMNTNGMISEPIKKQNNINQDGGDVHNKINNKKLLLSDSDDPKNNKREERDKKNKHKRDKDITASSKKNDNNAPKGENDKKMARALELSSNFKVSDGISFEVDEDHGMFSAIIKADKNKTNENNDKDKHKDKHRNRDKHRDKNRDKNKDKNREV